MSFTNAAENSVLDLLFVNVDYANVGDAAGLQNSAAAGSFYIALTTTSPTDAGTITGETTYTGYERVAVARTAGGWTVSGNAVSNAALVTFGENTAGTPTITHVAICAAGTKTVADVIVWAVLDAPLVMAVNTIPEFAIGALSFTLD